MSRAATFISPYEAEAERKRFVFGVEVQEVSQEEAAKFFPPVDPVMPVKLCEHPVPRVRGEHVVTLKGMPPEGLGLLPIGTTS